MALTDHKAIQVALWIAIDTEESLIDAYRGQDGKVNEDEDGVKIARRRIAAFKRVLGRYYGGEGAPKMPSGKSVSLTELLRDSAHDPA